MFTKRFTLTEYDENGEVIARSSRRLLPWTSIKAAAALGLALATSALALGGALFSVLALILYILDRPVEAWALAAPLVSALAVPLAIWSWRRAEDLTGSDLWDL